MLEGATHPTAGHRRRRRTCGPQTVGVLEIAYISMPAGARLLQKMGAETAVAFDSGGSATVWSAAGHGGCPHPWQGGSCFGLTQRVGLHWQRPVVSVSVLSYVR
jgi:hypothetical protein